MPPVMVARLGSNVCSLLEDDNLGDLVWTQQFYYDIAMSL